MEAEPSTSVPPATTEVSRDSKPIELDRRDRAALLFRKLSERGMGALVMMEGVDLPSIKRLGKLFSKVLDPRHYFVVRPEGFDKNRPMLHEYWNELPSRGDVALFEHSYYYGLVRRIRSKKIGRRGVDRAMTEIRAFETTLTNNGYLVIKLNLERGRKELKKEYKKKIARKPAGKIIRKRYSRLLKDYKQYTKLYSGLRGRSHEPESPWFSPGTGDKKELEATVLDFLIEYLENKLGIDSTAEVREFDEAMQKVRDMKQRKANVDA